MAGITSSLFDGWEKWPDERFARFRLPGGETLNRQTFADRHAEGGMVIVEIAKPEWVDACVAHPATQIASDGSWEQGETHPRVAGTHSRVLGHYVRERRLLTLESAIRKMTLLPALALQGAAPQLARKGRLQQGMDADLTVFDPETIADRATYEQPTLPPHGIDIVIVNGVIVVRNGKIVDGVTPGAAIRRTRGTSGPRPDATQP
jgi:dihydroorotase